MGDWNLNSEQFVQYEFYNQILETQSPRILRLGARISF
jgi:hypothetical protein